MGKTKALRVPTAVAVGSALALLAGTAQAQPVPETLRVRALKRVVAPLAAVPLLDAGPEFITYDRTSLQRLGKALFWDQQLGSDGQACASCHFHHGADNRSKNQINPGFRNQSPKFPTGDIAFGNSTLSPVSLPPFGPNYQLTLADFPLHRLSDPGDARSVLLSDTNDVISSQGVFAVTFTATGVPADQGTASLVDPANPMTGTANVFSAAGEVVRSVPPRNTPSNLNAVFNRRNFWDSRARDEFNGVDPIGNLDPTAQVVKVGVDALGNRLPPQFVGISIPGSSAASQAVGPPLSDLEMSYHGRAYADLGRKMLSSELAPLGQQLVATDDSLLGPVSAQWIAPGVTGLVVRYADLVRQAFPGTWWDAPGWRVDTSVSPPRLVQSADPGLFTVMEYNFAYFFGLAVYEYEKTLLTTDTPFDRFLMGDESALGLKERNGLEIFLGRGRCVECHSSPLLSNASTFAQDTFNRETDRLLPPHNIERMIIGSPCSPEELDQGNCLIDVDPVIAVYDAGFYNIGVRPTLEDVGIGANIGPQNLPLAHSKRLVDCVSATVPQLLAATPTLPQDAAVRQANVTCDVPHIAARPIEAAIVLGKAWSLASQNGMPVLDAFQTGNLIAEAKALLTGQPATAAGYQQASNWLVQARDVLSGDLGQILSAPIHDRLTKLIASATALLPDTVNPGPDPLNPFGPPLQPGERVNVMGSFKTPSLRGVEFTAPYFHNGGQATLDQVVEFYDRGGDFHDENMGDLDPNIAPIGLLPFEQEDLVAFLKALSDDRARWERAPFDHPSLSLPNGGTPGKSLLFGAVPFLDDRIELPAIGAGGSPIPLGTPGTPFANFPDPVWSRMGRVSGDGQHAEPGAPLAGGLVVHVLDAAGNPVAGVPVTFVAPPGAAVSPLQTTTGPDGTASAHVTLGPREGAQVFRAEAFAVAGSPITFTASAVRPTPAGSPDPTPPADPQTPSATAPRHSGGCGTASGGGVATLALLAGAMAMRRRRGVRARA